MMTSPVYLTSNWIFLRISFCRIIDVSELINRREVLLEGFSITLTDVRSVFVLFQVLRVPPSPRLTTAGLYGIAGWSTLGD